MGLVTVTTTGVVAQAVQMAVVAYHPSGGPVVGVALASLHLGQTVTVLVCVMVTVVNPDEHTSTYEVVMVVTVTVL